ncbi:MAG: FAD:protein FMN transferase [Gemmataceae bacterium]
MGRHGWAGIVVHLILAAGIGHAADPLTRYEAKSVHMGTEWRIVLYAPDQTAAEAATKAAFARVKQLDEVMSDYNPKSELMTLLAKNDADPGKPIPASDDLIRVLDHAQEVSGKCDGAFDVTVGPLVKLWRAARKSKELPKAADLKAAKELVGHKLLTVDAATKTVTLAKAGMRLDLGGIGKGFAADEALCELKKHGITRALIAASGDITAGDAPPGKDAWLVDIAPIGQGMPARRVKLANASVSTSGDLFQHVEVGGVRYSHVLDPNTGLGLTGRRSATVVAPKGWQADALTKAASVLPPDKARAVIEGYGGEMYLVVKQTEDAKEQATETKGFAKYEAK